MNDHTEIKDKMTELIASAAEAGLYGLANDIISAGHRLWQPWERKTRHQEIGMKALEARPSKYKIGFLPEHDALAIITRIDGARGRTVYGVGPSHAVSEIVYIETRPKFWLAENIHTANRHDALVRRDDGLHLERQSAGGRGVFNYVLRVNGVSVNGDLRCTMHSFASVVFDSPNPHTISEIWEDQPTPEHRDWPLAEDETILPQEFMIYIIETNRWCLESLPVLTPPPVPNPFARDNCNEGEQSALEATRETLASLREDDLYLDFEEFEEDDED